MKTAMKKRKK